jgi:hypothetical protein
LRIDAKPYELNAETLDDIFGCSSDNNADEFQLLLDDDDMPVPQSSSSSAQRGHGMERPGPHPVQGCGAPGQDCSAMPQWLINNRVMVLIFSIRYVTVYLRCTV